MRLQYTQRIHCAGNSEQCDKIRARALINCTHKKKYLGLIGFKILLQFMLEKAVKIAHSRYVHQGRLENVLKQIFPSKTGTSDFLLQHSAKSHTSIIEIKVNSRKYSSIKDPTTGRYLELDVWVPEFNLCFEFQVCFRIYEYIVH